jgi:hypothetical protein
MIGRRRCEGVVLALMAPALILIRLSDSRCRRHRELRERRSRHQDKVVKLGGAQRRLRQPGVGPLSSAARLKPKYANGRRPKPASKRVAEVAGRSVRTPAARERPAAIRHHLLRVVRQGTEEPAPGHPRMRSRLAAAVEQPPVIPRAGAAQEVRAAMSSAGCPPGAAPPAPRCPPPSSSRRENPYPCLVDASCFAQHMRWHQPTGRSVSRHKGDRGQSPDAW